MQHCIVATFESIAVWFGWLQTHTAAARHLLQHSAITSQDCSHQGMSLFSLSQSLHVGCLQYDGIELLCWNNTFLLFLLYLRHIWPHVHQ